MKRIGITGMSGSGKSYVCSIFEKYGIPSVNSDAIVHRLYATQNSCTETLALLYGKDILHEDHSINRSALAAIVFADREKLALLNKIVHPYVVEILEKQASIEEEKGTPAFLIDAPQLFEAGLDKHCDYIVSVIADASTIRSRLMQRDNLTQEAITARLANQHDEHFFHTHSDFCISNSNGDDVEVQVKLILKKIGLLL